jgi:trehalose 6-phosphate synthase
VTTQRHILVSKRSPLTYSRNASSGVLEAALAPGGTANVVADMACLLGVDWMCSAMTPEDMEVRERHPEGLRLNFTSTDRPITVHLQRHDAQVFADMQEIMTADVLWACNNTLWDSWNAPSFGEDTHRAWRHFEMFNGDFLHAVSARLEMAPDAPVLVHDYQLSILPGLLRTRFPRTPSLLFIHIPWPAPDYWSMLPAGMRTAFLEGMLGASVIGFFAHRWARNFLDCVRDLLPSAQVDREHGTIEYSGRRTSVQAMPLGYSPQAIDYRRKPLPEEVTAWSADRFLFVHSGRTDPIKNGARAIAAFRAACEHDAELCEQSRFLARCNPNRLYVNANSDYLAQLHAEAARTNERFGTELVRVICENDVGNTLGCLQEADALIFNSTIDGQNLTVFEGALVNRRDATVILSERAGAAEALERVVELVNPFDVAELARLLAEAFHATPAERRDKAAIRRERAREFDLPRWVAMQLNALERNP